MYFILTTVTYCDKLDGTKEPQVISGVHNLTDLNERSMWESRSIKEKLKHPKYFKSEEFTNFLSFVVIHYFFSLLSPIHLCK